MDRGAFLSALPFLQETVSATWPPQDRCQTLLKDHVVSIEPLSIDSDETIGPAVFSGDHSNDPSFDPALCSFEAAVCTAEGKNTSSQTISSTSTTLSSVSPSPRTPAKQTSERIDLYFRFNKQSVFRVDCSRLKRTKVIPGTVAKASQKSETKNGDSTTEKNKEKKPDAAQNGRFLPPCLLFYLESCCFRVFSMSAHGKEAKQQELQTTLTNLQAVPCGDGAPSLMETSSEITSPTGSSAQSSLEHGQREMHSGIGKLKTDETERMDGSAQDDAILRRIKRQHESMTNSWKGLLSLSTVLEMPSSALGSSLTSTQSVSETFGPLLTATAEDLGQGHFYTKPNAKTTAQYCNEEIHQQQIQINKLLAIAFPPPSKKRRGRGGVINATPQTQNTSPQGLKELVEDTKQVLAKQKEAIETRHRLALLP